MTGIEITRQIKNRVPSIAILILTAYDNDEYVFKLLDAGAAGYLLKDAGSHELLGAVRSVYCGESALHPAIARKVIQRALRREEKLEAQKTPEELSEREVEILKLAARGLTNKEIADELFLSARTVQGHLTSIFNKLSVGSRTEAIFKSAKKGWISFDDLQAEQPGG
jgi:DNA-binding NarL/FixJ family response regulator